MNKNILAENMRRFGTKNLNEQQLDAQPKTFEDLLRHVSDPTHESELWYPIDHADVIIGVTNRKGFDISDTSPDAVKQRIAVSFPLYIDRPGIPAPGARSAGGFKVEKVDVVNKRITMVPADGRRLHFTMELKPNWRHGKQYIKDPFE